MSNKYQNRLRELQRIKAMHKTTDQTDQSTLHVNVVTTSANSHSDQLHSVGAHELVRGDLKILGFVTASLLALLILTYWALIHTGLEGRLLNMIQHFLG